VFLISHLNETIGAFHIPFTRDTISKLELCISC
jgi:hypothetical protein